MRARLTAIACLAAALVPASARASTGTPEQIAWVRRAAGNFIAAELHGDGASACGILVAQMRTSAHGVSCQARWSARIRRMLREPGARARLRADRRADSTATVTVEGDRASIALPTPLLNGHSHFVWTENCWMLDH